MEERAAERAERKDKAQMKERAAEKAEGKEMVEREERGVRREGECREEAGRGGEWVSETTFEGRVKLFF